MTRERQLWSYGDVGSSWQSGPQGPSGLFQCQVLDDMHGALNQRLHKVGLSQTGEPRISFSNPKRVANTNAATAFQELLKAHPDPKETRGSFGQSWTLMY